MDSAEQQAAWILRRVGFGATGADLERAAVIGIDALLDELFDPESAGVSPAPSPFANVDLDAEPGDRQVIASMIAGWFGALSSGSRPTQEWLAWHWHGHLVCALSTVKVPSLMAAHIELFRSAGNGPFADLLAAVTIDAAMLRYLDGATSTGTSPNENYARELLELFAIGTNGFTEADVAAGSAALTGWTIDRTNGESTFLAGRHDDTPQRFLGVDGVHDVDTVIAAVTNHPDCPTFVVDRLANAVLGSTHTADTAVEATVFREDELHVGRLLRRLVEHGLDGASSPVVVAPVPWLAHAIRATDAVLPQRTLGTSLRSLGQVPLYPPNVAGWPDQDLWLSTSATAARLAVSGTVAELASAGGDAMVAATAGDLDALAFALGRPDGFSSSTAAALDATNTSGRTLLALALATPDLVIA